jgi:hypothetical protein
VSSRIEAICVSSVPFAAGLPAGVVLLAGVVSVGVLVVGVLVGVLVVGVGVAERGIFGGFVVVSGRLDLTLGVAGTVAVVGVVGVVAAGTVACATVVVTVCGLLDSEVSAAYAAAAAPSANTAATPRMVSAERQPGEEPTLPGAPAPHCRHQSCPGAIAAPQFAQP